MVNRLPRAAVYKLQVAVGIGNFPGVEGPKFYIVSGGRQFAGKTVQVYSVFILGSVYIGPV